MSVGSSEFLLQVHYVPVIQDVDVNFVNWNVTPCILCHFGFLAKYNRQFIHVICGLKLTVTFNVFLKILTLEVCLKKIYL